MLSLPEDHSRGLMPPYIMILEHVCIEEWNSYRVPLLHGTPECRAAEPQDVQAVSEVAGDGERNIALQLGATEEKEVQDTDPPQKAADESFIMRWDQSIDFLVAMYVDGNDVDLLCTGFQLVNVS